MSKRAYNFCAGPAALPEAVLQRAQGELLDWHGKGLSVKKLERRIAQMEETYKRLLAEHNKDDATGERGRVWDTPSGYKQISVLMQIRNRALEQLKSFSAEFGLSPASRGRVKTSDNRQVPLFDQPGETAWNL